MLLLYDADNPGAFTIEEQIVTRDLPKNGDYSWTIIHNKIRQRGTSYNSYSDIVYGNITVRAYPNSIDLLIDNKAVLAWSLYFMSYFPKKDENIDSNEKVAIMKKLLNQLLDIVLYIENYFD